MSTNWEDNIPDKGLFVKQITYFNTNPVDYTIFILRKHKATRSYWNALTHMVVELETLNEGVLIRTIPLTSKEIEVYFENAKQVGL